MKHFLRFLFVIFLLSPSLSFGFDQSDLDKLKATNECVGCDLSYANLMGVNLSGAVLTRVNFEGVNLIVAKS